ncbi:MAG: hypothetical protein ACREI7_10570, partial [Myxococcota bacterium]
MACPWITDIGVPISCASPATSVAIDASSSAARARRGLLQRNALLAQRALEDPALARELVGEVGQALLVPLDVGLDRHLHVERHPRSERR